MSNSNPQKDKLSQVHSSIDKAQAEAQAVQSQGMKAYLFQRKVSMKLIWFLASLGASFLVGVILAW